MYLRISEDRSGEGLAVERQRDDCAALIASRGWSHEGEYVDNDISAAGRQRRPGFEALLQAVAEGKADTVVALSLDRLTRNRRDQLRLIETCQENRVLVALVKGADVDMTTAIGRGMADMMAAFARIEIDQKGERHRSQIMQAAKAGKPGSGPRAFGYLRGGMQHHSQEAPVVAEMYQRFLAGAGLGELTDWLNLRVKLTTPKGAKWRPGSVRVVLANPRNAGLRGLRPVVDEPSGRRAQYHDIIAPARWPGIVDEPTWRAVMKVLTDPSRIGKNHPRGPRPHHLLSQLATCGRCGEHMISSSGGGARTYRCSSKMHLVRNAIQLEAYIQAVLIKRLRQADAVDLLRQERVDGEPLAALRDRERTLRARLDGLAQDYADGVLDRGQMRVAGDRLRAQIGEVQAEVAAAGEADVVAPLVLAQDDRAAWAIWSELPTSTQRLVIARVMPRIVVLRGRPGRPRQGAGFDAGTLQISWVN